MLLWINALLSKIGQGHDFAMFESVDFRTILALLLSCLFVLLSGPHVIQKLRQLKIGDTPEFGKESINQKMKGKKGVPTMGGIMIVGGILFACLIAGDLSRSHGFYLWAGMITMISLACIGGADDWLKLTAAKRPAKSRDGLKTTEKAVLIAGLAIVISYFIFNHQKAYYNSDNTFIGMSRSLNLPLLKSWIYDSGFQPHESLIVVTNDAGNVIEKGWRVLPLWLFILISTGMFWTTTNAVNITDGLDGLAGGTSVIVSLALVVLAFVAGHKDGADPLAQTLLMPHIPGADELSILAGAMAGSCIGFLWYNNHPAQVFMGDTGSLALGGCMAYIALVTRQEFLLLIIGGVFYIEFMTSFIQVIAIRKFNRRIWLCAPIHHHYQEKGWPETKIVSRAWILTLIFAAIALLTLRLH